MKLLLDGLLPPVLVVAVGALLTRLTRVPASGTARRFSCLDVAVIGAVVAFSGLVEIAMGRTPTYRHGPVRLWSGDVSSDENSQQIADPYTFTHVTHGVVLYGLVSLARPSWRAGLRTIAAVTAESAWEVLENTEMVIERYRTQTIALGYYGDSVINSLFDIAASLVGLLIAQRLPVIVTAACVLANEALLAVWIRDNLTLNIIMLIHRVDAIARWQSGG